ncbi:HAD hydrolase-like protein [Indioceanicola profundi]|uniref:HAD hydrolase-like protein n=1 Tax=Indioceanicola profundi TaxID=2220096 RepID=UPI000E6AB4A2|nr:HAD hydrolase-like protein [Indioceanicola profundi]
MPTRLVIFDFDGTLADSIPWFRTVLNQVAVRFNFRQLGHEEMEEVRRLGSREILARVNVPMWKLPMIAAHMRRRMAEEIGQIRLFPGVDDMFRQLHADGIRIAIVSSNSASNVRRVLGPELVPLVSHFGCGSSLFGKVPHIRKCLVSTGIPASEALCVGDEVRDLDAARKAGVAAAGVTWGYAHPSTLQAHGAPILFTNLDEIPRLLTSGAEAVRSV